MSEPVLLADVSGGVARLTLHRPEKLNALNHDLLHRLDETLQAWANDESIGAVVLRGSGRAFCAGGDVSLMARENDPRSVEQRIDTMRAVHRTCALLYSFPKVTIAEINGFAMGAGLGLCLACDLRIASEEAKFGTAYAKVGYSGDFGVTWLLTRYAGAPKAKELLFLAETFDAAEAARIGLVNRVVPQDQLEAEVGVLAARIARGPLISYRYMKANVNQSATVGLLEMLDREAETNVRCGMTADHQEGVRAFQEKRMPNFLGR